MLRSPVALALPLVFALPLAFALAACGEGPLDDLSSLPAPGDLPAVAPSCGERGVPVITGITTDWDDQFVDWITVEVHGLRCGADVSGFGFRIFDDAERDITGRSWPELDSIEQDDDAFVLRGEAAGCGSFRAAARIEVDIRGQFGTRCAQPVRSEPASASVRPFEAPADH